MDQPIAYNFYYWGPYLWKSKISEEICDEILQRGLRSEVDHRTKLASIIEDVRKFDEKEDQNYLISILEPYLNCYLESKLQFSPNSKINKLESVNFWINFQQPGEINPEHTHNDDLSFVLYLNVPEGIPKENQLFQGTGAGPGQIVFRYGEQSNWAVSLQSFIPTKGDVFIFPANLSHSALPFKSPGTRISVSGNFKFIYD